jgi:GNAT superfamily N-acetyltransferase
LNTVFLSDSEVAAYLKDLLGRLQGLGELMPRVWCPIGPSGVRLAQLAMVEAAKIDPDLPSRICQMPITFDRKSRAISFPDEADPGSVVKDEHILLFDGFINSGGTIIAAYRAVEAMNPREVSSYSLVIRRGTSFIPCFFGIMTGNHDRVHFLRDVIPNNRLPDFGCVRKLSEEDLEKPMVQTGEDFIDKFTWSEYKYEMEADPRRRTYLYERGGVLQGFVSFRHSRGKALLVDTLGVGRQYQKQGIAGHLLRWAETYGRHTGRRAVLLWGVEQQKDFYEKRGFRALGKSMTVDGARFFLMGRKLLYDLPDDVTWS